MDRTGLRWIDLAEESWRHLARRPLRSVMTALGIAVGVAAIVVNLTLTTTIRFQVADEFDQRIATQIEVRPSAQSEGHSSADVLEDPAARARVVDMSGVEGVAIVRTSLERAQIRVTPIEDRTRSAPVSLIYGIDSLTLETLEGEVDGGGWSSWHDETSQRVVVVPDDAAVGLGLSGIKTGDYIYADGVPLLVVGTVSDIARLPALQTGLLVPLGTLESFGVDDVSSRLIVVTAPGAGKNVAESIRLALLPESPDDLASYLPAQDASLRMEVDGQIQRFSLVLGAVIAALGAISISNATLTSVLQRYGEIGLRRALGARPSHIALHVVVDAGLLGLLGSSLGCAVGVTTSLLVSIAEQWQPIIDLQAVFFVLLGGGVLGALAGVYPAFLAARLQPTEALRHP